MLYHWATKSLNVELIIYPTFFLFHLQETGWMTIL